MYIGNFTSKAQPCIDSVNLSSMIILPKDRTRVPEFDNQAVEKHPQCNEHELAQRFLFLKKPAVERVEFITKSRNVNRPLLTFVVFRLTHCCLNATEKNQAESYEDAVFAKAVEVLQ